MRPNTTVNVMDRLGEIFLCTWMKGPNAVGQRRYLTYPDVIENSTIKKIKKAQQLLSQLRTSIT